jgi:hypothetical protein
VESLGNGNDDRINVIVVVIVIIIIIISSSSRSYSTRIGGVLRLFTMIGIYRAWK